MHSELANVVKNEINGMEDLEPILRLLTEKTKAKSLGFVGVGDDYNGLSLIDTSKGDFDNDIFSGLISNIYQSVMQLRNSILDDEVKYSLIDFKENVIFLYYITPSVAFAGILPHKNEMGKIHLWMSNYRKKLNKLFSTE